MAAAKEASIRLGTTGKAEVKQTFAEIGDSGDAAAKRWSKSWERASADADAALARQARAAEKLAAIMPKSAIQMQAEAAAGSNTRLGGGYAASGADRLGQFEGSARASADAFRALFAEEERLEKQAIALRAAIDPVWGAQQRFNQEMSEARTLISAGRISLDEYVVKLRQEQAALDAVSGQHGKVGEKSNAMRTAMAGASYQVQDFITQISMGANPIQAFVVQGGQLAGQFQHVEGRAGALASFFMGGWGLAIQAALMVVPPLASALWDAAHANDEASEASKRHAEAVKALRDAVERLNGQQATRNHNTRQGIQDDLDAAEAARQHEIRVRGLLDAQLQQQRAELRASETASRTAIGGSVPGAAAMAADVRAGAARDQIAAIEGALRINDGKRADAERAIATGRRLLVMRQIAGETDKATAANQRYEDTIDRLTRQFEAGKISENTFRRLATDADTAKKKALELAEAGKKVVNEFGREVTSAQASAIARAAGLTVNSADRSVERQRQLYNAWVAAGKPADNPVAKPGSSAHNRGNALDIQMSAGVTVAKIKAAFEAEGVRLTKIITERGHWHIEWARTASQKQADKDMGKDVRDAAAAHRELQNDVDGLIKLLDPARAAGDAYAQTLLTIAKAEQAGMLTQGEALGYRLTAAQQERDRRGKELVQASTAMFGGEDPLKDLLDRGQREREQQVDLWNENRQRGMDSYRSVADFYLNAMNGGTRSIWDLFRQNGLRVLSELLAKWTVGQSGSGGGLLKLLGLAGSAAGGTSAEALRMAQYDVPAGIQMPPGFATGTEYAPGGWARVGEFGQELIRLPRGSQVKSAAATRGLMAGNDNGARGGDTHNYFSGNLMTPEFWQMIQAGNDSAAMRGAAGGSAMGQAEQKATAAKRLGRRW